MIGLGNNLKEGYLRRSELERSIHASTDTNTTRGWEFHRQRRECSRKRISYFQTQSGRICCRGKYLRWERRHYLSRFYRKRCLFGVHSIRLRSVYLGECKLISDQHVLPSVRIQRRGTKSVGEQQSTGRGGGDVQSQYLGSQRGAFVVPSSSTALV